MRVFTWLLRAAVFFALFAFALNNQQEVAVHWFFGFAWHAPMVIVVLVAFAAGCAIGVLAMVPAWWRHRLRAQGPAAPPLAEPARAAGARVTIPAQLGAEAAVTPPRDAWS